MRSVARRAAAQLRACMQLGPFPHARRRAAPPRAPGACATAAPGASALGACARVACGAVAEARTRFARRLLRPQKQFSTSAGLSGVIGYASAILVKALAGGALTMLAATFAFLKARPTRGCGARPNRRAGRHLLAPARPLPRARPRSGSATRRTGATRRLSYGARCRTTHR